MALEELAERIELAVAHGEHQLMVGKSVGRGVHGIRREGTNHGRTRLNTDFCKIGDHGWSNGRKEAWLDAAGNPPGRDRLQVFLTADARRTGIRTILSRIARTITDTESCSPNHFTEDRKDHAGRNQPASLRFLCDLLFKFSFREVCRLNPCPSVQSVVKISVH